MFCPSVPAQRKAKRLQWRREDLVPAPLLAPVRSWLLDDGSLTQHLLDTGRHFSLQRWQQRWELPELDECAMLRMRHRERAMVRQVVLRLDGEAMVYARSVFPISTLSGPLLRLRRLANQSLGAFLFSRNDMRRSPFEVALLDGTHPYIPAALHQSGSAWARRSCFRVAERDMLVSEVFLQGFPRWQSPTPLHRSRRGQVSATIGRSAV